MEQHRVRLGDVLDDYCPREGRVTIHAVGALGCLLREPAAQRLCHDARGEDMLVRLLSTDSSQVISDKHFAEA